MCRFSLSEMLTKNKDTVARLLADQRCFYIVNHKELLGVTDNPAILGSVPSESLFISHPVKSSQLGAESFQKEYNVKYSYMAGAMANGIAGEKLVIALGSSGILSSFGAGGLPLSRVEDAIITIKMSLGQRTFAVNLIHSTLDKMLEMKTVELFLKHNVNVIEASAFMRLTPAVIYYRAKGLSLLPDGSVSVKNRIIAKVSRQSVGIQFMKSAPKSIVNALLAEGKITEIEARLLELVPVADDITVEADSGGHTDNLPLVNILPEMIQTRNELMVKNAFSRFVRIGAAGGISTPFAAHAAFSMGADYVVTGSVNQSCVESSTSDAVKKVLALADVPDVTMAPAADMFELGVKVQVLKKGVLYPVRAQILYDLYKKYTSIDEMSVVDRDKVEKDIFQRPIADVWSNTEEFFKRTAPHILEKAYSEPKTMMALIFRWYLGLAARWATKGESDRESDYQIWCGPSMGAFNHWVKGTLLEDVSNRIASEVAEKIMSETATLLRLSSIKAAGFKIS